MSADEFVTKYGMEAEGRDSCNDKWDLCTFASQMNNAGIYLELFSGDSKAIHRYELEHAIALRDALTKAIAFRQEKDV